MAKSYRRVDVSIAMESVFAEYQVDLFEEYDVFAIDGGYESGDFDQEKLVNRLKYYGAVGTQMEFFRLQLLSDAGNADFLKQTVDYVRTKTGMGWLESERETVSTWENQKEDAKETAEKETQVLDQMEELILAEGKDLPQKDNPIAHISDIKNKPILELVLPQDRHVSDKTLGGADLFSERSKNVGIGEFYKSADNGAIVKLALYEYAQDHFGSYDNPKEGRALDYEMEYLLAGEKNDEDNLSTVANHILGIRFGANYLYLQTDSGRKSEALALATTLCTLFQVPAITEAVKQGILLAWAYGEGIMDVRSLMEEKKVPLIKGDENWQLSLSGLLTLGTGSEESQGMDSEEGMDYLDYIRLLFYLEDSKECSDNMLSLIEKNLHLKGKNFIRIDHMATGIGIDCESSVRRNIKYSYKVALSYG